MAFPKIFIEPVGSLLLGDIRLSVGSSPVLSVISIISGNVNISLIVLVFNNTDKVLPYLFATAKSSFPSLLKSPITIERGYKPVA